MIDNAFAIRNDHPKTSELKSKIKHCKQRSASPPISTQTGCKFINRKQYEHTVKQGDQLGELCKRVYGKTGQFKLVHAVVEYNGIDPDDLEKGQRIKFPIIKCNQKTYYPDFENKQPPPKPSPIPTPTVFPKPTPEDIEETYKHEHYSQGVEHLKQERFEKAKYEFNLVFQKDADYLDVTQKIEEAALGGMIKDGRGLFDTAQYDQAIKMFRQVSSLQRDNRTAIEYLHKACFEKALSRYKGGQRSKALTYFEKCFHYDQSCRECGQYKKKEKREFISRLASYFEKESKRDVRKDTLQQLVKALKLHIILFPDDKEANRRLAEAQKLLEGFN